jgi:hypothetical protein
LKSEYHVVRLMLGSQQFVFIAAHSISYYIVILQ